MNRFIALYPDERSKHREPISKMGLRSSGIYAMYEVIDEKLFMLSVIKNGIEFEEIKWLPVESE
jgi:hypothetical protein